MGNYAPADVLVRRQTYIFVHYLTEVLRKQGLPQKPKSEVCGKFKTCRAHRNTATSLPAVSFLEKGSVLGGSGICRILPAGVSGSAGKTKICQPDPSFAATRPAVLLAKSGLCSAFSDFSPHFRKNAVKASVQKRRHDNYPSENSPLNVKTAFRRLPRTKPDVPSQGLIKDDFMEESGCGQSFFQTQGQRLN